MEYTFSAVGMDQMPSSASLIRRICEMGTTAHLMEHMVLVEGQIRARFGEALIESENAEEGFLYCISAVPEEGAPVCLELYWGSGGPSVGGTGDAQSRRAADALAEYILGAQSVDYARTTYDLDVPSRIDQGVKNGRPFYVEEPLELTDTQLDALCRRLYQLGE